jgi:hypothetical protein
MAVKRIACSELQVVPNRQDLKSGVKGGISQLPLNIGIPYIYVSSDDCGHTDLRTKLTKPFSIQQWATF